MSTSTKFLSAVSFAALAFAGASALQGCDPCLDQVGCASVTRAAALTFPEFTIPSFEDQVPAITLTEQQYWDALEAIGVDPAALEALGIDITSLEELDAAGVEVDGMIEVLLLEMVAELEESVNAEIAAGLPEGTTAEVSLEGVEDLEVPGLSPAINEVLIDLVSQLSLRVKVTTSIPSLSELSDGQIEDTSFIEAIELQKIGVRTLGASEPVVTEPLLVSSTELRSNCVGDQPKIHFIRSLRLKITSVADPTKSSTLFDTTIAPGTQVCGFVAESTSTVDLFDYALDGATIELELSSNFPLQGARMLSGLKASITGYVEIPGSIQEVLRLSGGTN
jgi:hypothetical protein